MTLPKPEYHQLLVRLTPDELRQRGQALAALLEQIERETEEEKERVREWKSRLAVLEKEAYSLRNSITSRQETRTVECVWIEYPDIHEMRLIRTDSDEVVATQALAHSQLSLVEGA